MQQLPHGLLWGFSLALSLLVALGELSYRNIEHQADAANWVEHTHQVAEGLVAIFSVVQDADNSVRTFALTGVESASLQPYLNAVQTLPGAAGRHAREDRG